MIDFTKLRDLIVEKKCVSSNDYGKEDPFIGIYWEDLINIINQCDSVKWISVDEALPEKNKMCFVRKETELGIIYDADYVDWEGKWFFNFNRTSMKSMVITHWMPIPSLEGGEE